MEYQIYYNQLLTTMENSSPNSKNSWDLTPSDNSVDNADFEWSELKIDTEDNAVVKIDGSQSRKRKFAEIGTDNDDNQIEKLKINNFSNLSRKENLLKIPIQWQNDINDLNADIIESSFGNLENNDAFSSINEPLAISGLTVFKQEATSPSHENNAKNRQSTSAQKIERNNLEENSNDQLNSTISQLLNTSYNLQNTFDASLVASPSSQEFNVSSTFGEDCRFQYVLAAATSIATKINEDTLTYLNQGQSYEIKLKKLGDLSMYRGKMLRSNIRICFHERRLQYMEKEQMASWQKARPGDRILDVDVPLSYGAVDIIQPSNALNLIHFNWDPTKEVGVYIKVNCISTEFTPKKRGGEKGVPFRIQVETYPTTCIVGGENNCSSNSSEASFKRLHAAACQVKVFKLKGADRKHKQDREKIMRRPLTEQEKYQPSYECTVLTDIPNDAVLPCSPIAPLSPGESDTSSNKSNSLPNVGGDTFSPVQTAVNPSTSSLSGFLRNVQGEERKIASDIRIKSTSSSDEVSDWLIWNRFQKFVEVFQNFNGHDLLRLSRKDVLQICGEADGIRFFNILHDKAITPRSRIYVRKQNTNIFHAIFLTSSSKYVLKEELCNLLGINSSNINEIFMEGPNDIRVIVSDSVVYHIREESAFMVDVIKSGESQQEHIILKQISNQE